MRSDACGWGGAAHPAVGCTADSARIAGVAAILAAARRAAISLLLAFASINLKADQTIGGTALNMLAPAFAVVLTWAIQGQGQTTILIPNWTRITVRILRHGYGVGFPEPALDLSRACI